MTSPSADRPEFDPNRASMPDKDTSSVQADKASGANLSPLERMRQAVQSRQAGADDDREVEMWSGGYSSKAMLGYWVGAAALTLLLPIALVLVSANGMIWMIWAIAMLLLWGGSGLIYLYRRLTVKYELTSQRFIHQSGLLRRITDRIEVIDIDDVSVEQGLVERVVGVGTIKLLSSDTSHPQLLLRGIDQAKTVAGLIDDLRRGERRRRGLHIETV